MFGAIREGMNRLFHRRTAQVARGRAGLVPTDRRTVERLEGELIARGKLTGRKPVRERRESREPLTHRQKRQRSRERMARESRRDNYRLASR